MAYRQKYVTDLNWNAECTGEVVSLGDGRVGYGEVKPFYLKPGQTVVYSKFGFMYTDLKMSDGTEYILIREDDVIGVMPRASEYNLGWRVLPGAPQGFCSGDGHGAHEVLGSTGHRCCCVQHSSTRVSGGTW